MDIRHLNSNQLREQAAARTKAEGEQRANRTASSEGSTSSDTVHLSRDAAALQEISLKQSVEPFDAGRVESIRRAIAEGRYHVDPERLAENFSRLESELIQ